MSLFQSLPSREPKATAPALSTSYLYSHKMGIFDYPRFAQPFRDELRENAERLAKENEIEIEHIRKRKVRKEHGRRASDVDSDSRIGASRSGRNFARPLSRLYNLVVNGIPFVDHAG